MIESQRHLFDVPPEVAYFNCAYASPLLRRAANQMAYGVHLESRPWMRTAPDFFSGAEDFRRLAASAFGGDAENYAVIPSASYGIATVTRIFETELQPGDDVLVLGEAFPSNYLPWHRLVGQTGGALVVVPPPADFNWTAAVLAHITPRTKVLALPHCHWTNGAVLDLESIAVAARDVGAYLVLEVTQSIGVMPLNFAQLQPDFLIAAGYKWMLAPYSLSLFYADPKWHQARPLEETWLSRSGADNFQDLANYADTYQAGARRFEMGQKGNATLLPAANMALEQIGAWGVAEISTTLKAMTDRIAVQLEGFGLTPIPAAYRSPHILGAVSQTGLPDSLIPDLAAHNVHISRRGNALRFAPYLHINEGDMDRLFTTLADIL